MLRSRCSVLLAGVAVADALSVTLDPNTAIHTYDGHGALSAGASSRLLWDYPEPQRSEVLDYLFKPNFGANLHLLKVEIGGDGQSTDGTEPSPQHNRNDPMDCARGYEPWLLQQAKQRNPDILTYGLSWAVPHWIGNGSYFTADNIQYQTSWAACIQQLVGSLDYIGIWNERSWGSPNYVVNLRDSLDAAGLSNTQIILPDGGSDIAGIISNAESNVTFKDAISGVGLHYPCADPDPVIQGTLDKKYWASEDYSTVADWAGAGCWGRMLVQNYVRMNMTSTISWSLIWSVYPNLPYFGNGLMYAMEPWSGHYSGGGHAPGQDPVGDLMNGPIWTSAHFTQFTQPGWKFLSVPGGGSGLLPGGGSYVTLIPSSSSSTGAAGHMASGPATAAVSDFTVILETLEGDCLRCKGSSTVPQNVSFTLAAGMPGPGTTLAVWRTNATVQFVQQAHIIVGADGSFTVFIGSDEMVTVSTIKTAAKGSFPGSPIPASAPFPMPYADTFDQSDYPYDHLAKYFSDQAGSFAVRNGSLVQLVNVDPGPNAWVASPDPISLIGGQTTDAAWADYSVSATVTFGVASTGSAVAALGASGDGNIPAAVSPCSSAGKDPYQSWALGNPASGYFSNTPAGNVDNQLCLNLDGCGSSAIYYQCVTSGGTCCGGSCYAGLQWALPTSGSTGTVTSPLSSVAGQCLTVDGTGAVFMAKCGAGNQTWGWDASSGVLALQGTGQCLTAPVSLSPVYTQVCGRIAGYSGFTKAAPPAYCLALDNNGTWFLRAGSNVLASGALSIPGSGVYNSSSQAVTLSLTMKGNNITASATLAGTNDVAGGHQASSSAVVLPPVTVPDNTYTAGMAAVGSGFHWAAFDDFALAPA